MIERYGEEKIPEGMTIQDWAITYEEMETYYDKFEKTAGISGERDPWASTTAAVRIRIPRFQKHLAGLTIHEAAKKLGYHP